LNYARLPERHEWVHFRQHEVPGIGRRVHGAVGNRKGIWSCDNLSPTTVKSSLRHPPVVLNQMAVQTAFVVKQLRTDKYRAIR
jgi:hypothetical protein